MHKPTQLPRLTKAGPLSDLNTYKDDLNCLAGSGPVEGNGGGRQAVLACIWGNAHNLRPYPGTDVLKEHPAMFDTPTVVR